MSNVAGLATPGAGRLYPKIRPGMRAGPRKRHRQIETGTTTTGGNFAAAKVRLIVLVPGVRSPDHT
jgi:hypothetical protein